MKNTTIKFEIEGIGTINVSATMKGESRGIKQFGLPHYMYNLKIWSEHGKMSVTFHDSALKQVENGCRREYEKFMVGGGWW